VNTLLQVSFRVGETSSLVAAKHCPLCSQVFWEQRPLSQSLRLSQQRGKIIHFAHFSDISREGTAPRKSVQSKETGTSKFLERGRILSYRARRKNAFFRD